MKGQSEYICERFSSSSEAIEVEFRMMRSVPRNRMYIISPKNAQRHTHTHSALHSPNFARHSLGLNRGSLAKRTRLKSESGAGPGGRGYPFLSMRFRRIRPNMTTVTTVSSTSAMTRVGEVYHSISLLWGSNCGDCFKCTVLSGQVRMHASSCISGKPSKPDEARVIIPIDIECIIPT